MCLINEGRIVRAPAGIVCWKICRLLPEIQENGKKAFRIATQYNHKGQTIYIKGGKQKASGFPRMRHARKFGAFIQHEHDRGFYAFLTREDAEKFKTIARNLNKTILLKCIVPEGTRYISGTQVKFAPLYSDRHREIKAIGIRAEYMIHGIE